MESISTKKYNVTAKLKDGTIAAEKDVEVTDFGWAMELRTENKSIYLNKAEIVYLNCTEVVSE